jgi:hypothetical protein
MSKLREAVQKAIIAYETAPSLVSDSDLTNALLDDLRAAIAEPAPVPTQEPVAWKWATPLCLYTASPQTPMTEEQITEAWVSHGMNVMTFARAVERYHGIGEK